MFSVPLDRQAGAPCDAMGTVGKDRDPKESGGMGTKKYFLFFQSIGSQRWMEINQL